MLDLESTLHYVLRHEIPLHGVIKDGPLEALKNVVTVLARVSMWWTCFMCDEFIIIVLIKNILMKCPTTCSQSAVHESLDTKNTIKQNILIKITYTYI